MAVEWKITGQAGKTVDASEHTLEQLQAQGAIVEFKSLAADTMSWTIWLRNAAQVAIKVPDDGQMLTLWRNGVRYFTGLVTVREPDFSSAGIYVNIVVENAWWWLKQLFLSDEVPDQKGDESERTAYVFPTGSPRAHLIALIARAIQQGAPISEGNIASCFNVPRLSLRNIPLSEAMSEVMRWIADGICYFEYSGTGEPKLSMQRRTPAATLTINPANFVTVPRIRLKPRQELKVEEVKVMYAKRQTFQGKRITVYSAYTAGTSTSGIRQPVLVSGPEKVFDLLPQDFTDSVVVRSAPLDIGKIIARYDERLRATGATGFSVGTFTENKFGGGTFTLPAVNTQITDADGNPISAAFNKYLTLGEPKDWWAKDGIEHVRARVAATVYSTQRSPVPVPSGYEPTVPGWFEVLGGQHYFYSVSAPGGIQRVDVWAATSSVSVPLVKTLWNVPTTIIRAEDYGFVTPPADLADNLLETQNWLPYQGTISYIVPEGEAGHHVGKALNVTAVLPEWTNMRALIVGHTVKLSTGETTLTVGSPDRFTYRDLVSRYRQNGADNIVWLNGSVSGNPGGNPPPDPGLIIPEWPDGTTVYDGLAIAFDGAVLTYTT